MSQTKVFFLIVFFCSFAFTEEKKPVSIQVDLRNPTYTNGILYTSQGGVIQNEDIRIQAESMQYFIKKENSSLTQTVEAEGDVMLQYKGRVFVGSELEFDFQKMTGVIYDGKTEASFWFVGGDKIELRPDGSYRVTNAFVTTCESKDATWDLRASRVNVIKNELFEAKKVRFRFLRFPALWLPSFKLNLKRFKNSVFRYYVNWNKGPLAGLRYQLYSGKDWAMYARAEYLWKKGWGGALESEYIPLHSQTKFMTRNYVGTKRLFNAEDTKFRYRLQGAFFHRTKSEKTDIKLTWDKYSDVRMPGDFKSSDFEVNTALQTLLFIHHKEKNFLSSLKVEPKVNSFQSLKQELPTLLISSRLLDFKKTKILHSGFLKASYLDFSYSDDLVQSLNNFQSPRIEAYEKFMRPFSIGVLTLTPEVSGRAIFYGKSPSHEEKWLGVLGYGAKAHVYGKKTYRNYSHLIEPYAHYQALTRPTVSPNSHYIFSIEDGYEKIQELKVGTKHLFFLKKASLKEPEITLDLYARAFFSDPVIPQMIPKAYLDIDFQLPSMHLSFKNCYNFQNQLLDFSNTKLKLTVNENIALHLEGRYRSKYDWRKSDRENFILDVTRSERELLNSPLSDRRVTLLSNLFIRLNPFWELKFESHHGLYRLYKNEIQKNQSYNEFRIHLYTWISSAWKLHFYYGYTLNNHFDWNVSVQLVKKQF